MKWLEKYEVGCDRAQADNSAVVGEVNQFSAGYDSDHPLAGEYSEDESRKKSD